MIIVKTLIEKLTKEILDKYEGKSKDFLICQHIENMPDYMLRLLKRKFFLINSQKYYYNSDFLVVPKGVPDVHQLELDVENVSLIITDFDINFQHHSEKSEDESDIDYLARLDEIRRNFKIKIILEESKKRIFNVANQIQYIQTQSNDEEFDIFE